MLVKCEKCGGDVTVAALRTRLLDVHLVGTMSVRTSPVEARVCTECGFIALYAQSPGSLWPHPNEKILAEAGEFRTNRPAGNNDNQGQDQDQNQGQELPQNWSL